MNQTLRISEKKIIRWFLLLIYLFMCCTKHMQFLDEFATIMFLYNLIKLICLMHLIILNKNRTTN